MPENVYRSGILHLKLSQALKREGKDFPLNQLGFIADRDFLTECLGYRNVEWSRPLTVADSTARPKSGQQNLAYIVVGAMYFEGRKVLDVPSCNAA